MLQYAAKTAYSKGIVANFKNDLGLVYSRVSMLELIDQLFPFVFDRA
jgi:hypothetical protein